MSDNLKIISGNPNPKYLVNNSKLRVIITDEIKIDIGGFLEINQENNYLLNTPEVKIFLKEDILELTNEIPTVVEKPKLKLMNNRNKN